VSFAETRIRYGDDVAYEPEEPPEYGELVTKLVVRKGWISPNYMLGNHWSRTRPLRKEINEQVKHHILTLPPEERERVVLREPEYRILRLALIQNTGRYPDVDNVMGGLKHLIDSLKKVTYRHKKIRENVPDGVYRHHTGNGLIWDDSPHYLRIAEVTIERPPKGQPRDKKAGSYVVVEVFSPPSGESST